MTKRKIVYLDNAATTPVDPAVFRKMQPYFFEHYGNPSTIYRLGEKSRNAVEKARKQLADFLNCSSEEIYFTGSASESDNWAICGTIDKIWEKKNKKNKKPHLIVSSIEHKAVIEPAKLYKNNQLSDVTFLPVNKEGIIGLKELEKAVKKNTRLISVMYANSEIGTVQPIAEIGELIKQLNRKRKNKILFHTDAVQAINYLDCDVEKLGVDFLSLSGHKIYGPKGIGALYIKKGTPIASLIRGGGQEKGMRSGTENVPGIVGLGEAISRIKKSQAVEVKKLRNKLITRIKKDISKAQLNGSFEKRLPNNAHFSFDGAEGESIVMELSQKNIFVSTGSACASNSLSPSHVLDAIGLSHEKSHCSVRFSLGKQNTESDIDSVLKHLPIIIKRLRKIAGK